VGASLRKCAAYGPDSRSPASAEDKLRGNDGRFPWDAIPNRLPYAPSGSGSVCCSGDLRAPELPEDARPAARDCRYKNQTDPLRAITSALNPHGLMCIMLRLSTLVFGQGERANSSRPILSPRLLNPTAIRGRRQQSNLSHQRSEFDKWAPAD
jgi:hypothetical protein